MKASTNIGLLFVLALSPALMGFDRADPWDSLEGEWAYGTTDACEHNTLTFSFDYKRDRYGAIEYPPETSFVQRDRLATIRENGVASRRVSVGRRMEVETDTDGARLHLRIRRPASSPFRGWSAIDFQILDDDTLQVLPTDGDGQWLIDGMGGMPATLVRCL